MTQNPLWYISAVKAEILSNRKVRNETRYEIKVLHSYRSTFSLLSLEYLWSPTPCPCPNMEVGQEYIIVGDLANHAGNRETRLQVNVYVIHF